MVHFRFGRIRLPDTCESALTKIQSSQNFSKADTPIPFHILAIDT